jgi:phospholipase C
MLAVFVVTVALFVVSGARVEALGDWTQRIKHVIVVMEENRSFDHLLGWLNRSNINGLTGDEYNKVNTTVPHSEKLFVTRGAPYVNKCDPNHGTLPTAYKLFGPEAYDTKNFTGTPSMCCFVEFENDVDHTEKKDYCNVMNMFDTTKQLPVLTALADNFLVMDRFFASIPGPTWPNRQFFLSAQSEGLTETFYWYRNISGRLYPQRTFFDQVAERNGTWSVYYHDTPWELFMESIAHHPENLHSIDQFYKDAAAGTFPDYAFINPRSGINMTTGEGSNDMHPDHDVALGEAMLKDIYEAIRSSPAWNETLLILTFDEHGGFYDHVPPPSNVPPPFEHPSHPSYPDVFRFDRLGVRIPTLLISPWVRRGSVISSPPEAQRPQNNSEYDLTSIMATTRKLLPKLFGAEPLTGRDAWAATFEHAFTELDEPRTDCPMTLPDPPKPHWPTQPPLLGRVHSEGRDAINVVGAQWPEAAEPVNGLQSEILTFVSNAVGEPYPSHIQRQEHVSDWAQRKFLEHKTKTAQWKSCGRSGDSPSVELCNFQSVHVELRPVYLKEPGSHPFTRDFPQQWLLNKAVVQTGHGSSGTPIYSVRMTLSARVENHTFCLDNAGGQDGSRVTASVCYPTASPATNRDPNQWWSFTDEGTLKPFQNTSSSLCLTNHYFAQSNSDESSSVESSSSSSINSTPILGNTTLVLAPCVEGMVQQHYAYHGDTSNGVPGMVLFGDGLLALTLRLQ